MKIEQDHEPMSAITTYVTQNKSNQKNFKLKETRPITGTSKKMPERTPTR